MLQAANVGFPGAEIEIEIVLGVAFVGGILSFGCACGGRGGLKKSGDGK